MEKHTDSAAEFFVPAREIFDADFPDPIWIVRDLLPIGLCLFAGKAKLGKSWQALQLARAVASGGEFLGRRLDQGKVVYLALEDSPRRLQSRMKTQGWTDDQIDNVTFVFARQFRETIGNLTTNTEKLVDLLADLSPRLVIIDTLSRVTRSDQNDTAAMTQALEWLQTASHEHEFAVVLIDHHKKGFVDMDAIANVLGSTAKGAVADTIWGLYRERGKSSATLAVTGRDVEEKSWKVWIDWKTGTWKMESTQGEPTSPREAILEAIRDMGPSTNQEIADAVGRNKGNVHRDIQEMRAEGVVHKSVSNKYILPLEE